MKMKSIKRIVPVLLVSAMLTGGLTACGSNGGTTGSKAATGSMTSSTKMATEKFPAFKGKDFDGNDVDESIFGQNDVTLVNFWFNGCSACVNEMPELEEFGKKLKEKGAELIGINAGTASDEKGLAEAKDILSKQGATYRNLILPQDHEYVRKIFSFPTTILVDKNGNIIGDPIVGDIKDEKRQEEILKAVEDIKAGNNTGVKSDTPNESEMDKLVAQEQEIFLSEHKAIWDKVFATINKEEASKTDKSYPEFLKSAVEKIKDQFTADELKNIDEDLAKVAEIEKKLDELYKSMDNKASKNK